MSATEGFRAIGTRVAVTVADPVQAPAAGRLLREEVDALDLACSRFRPDSDLSRVNAAAGSWVAAGPLLVAAIRAAVGVAARTDGLVDPLLGRQMCAAGYDRTFDELPADRTATATATAPWSPAAVEVDADDRHVRVAPGCALDLGATAKAFAADRAVARIAAALGCGVLVDLGGDLAVAGGSVGWPVRVVDGPCDGDDPGQQVALTVGGLATSSTILRRWRAGGREHHHVLDPRTGGPAAQVWRTVTVAAASCLDANAASTAAVVLGADAPGWLEAAGLPARLVRQDRTVVRTAGWPA